MIRDPVAAIRAAVAGRLSEASAGALRVDRPLGSGIPWSPHLYETRARRAWHCVSEIPSNETWAARMRAAIEVKSGLRLGLAGPTWVLGHEELLAVADDLNAALWITDEEEGGDRYTAGESYFSVSDFIYQTRLRLSGLGARTILDRALQRALDEPDKNKKGVRLEVLTAVLLSQVVGYEVSHVGISNRSQQLDVMVHNRNTSGILRSSELVIAEAKNWTKPPGTEEYYSLVRKIESRHGRSSMGFFVTTDRFTRGVGLEMARDSRGTTIVVPLDKQSLPATWRSKSSITEKIEQAVIEASVGTDPGTG